MRARRISALLGCTALMVAALTAPAAAKQDGSHGQNANAGSNGAAHRADGGSAATPAEASTSLPDAASDTAVEHARRVCAAPQPDFAACHAHVRTTADGVTPHATSTFQNGFSAAQLRTAYGISGGSTTTVAVVDAYRHPAARDDLLAYRAAMNITEPLAFTEYNQSGQTSGFATADVGWGQEEMLDLEMVSAICPTCKIAYFGAKSALFSDLAAAVRAAAALPGVTVISNSYGGPESSSLLSAYGPSYDQPGKAITVSSGDSGYGVQAPASFRTVTAVGGTHLVLNADGSPSETVWSGAGSGCSAYTKIPSWQSSTITKCSRRMVADVAAVADPNTGVAVYDSYGSSGGLNWMVFGGTSVAAPIIGAVYAQSADYAGTPVAATSVPNANLNDVTSGSNGRCVRGKTGAALWCNGAVGYDGPTGMGTPIGTSAF